MLSFVEPIEGYWLLEDTDDGLLIEHQIYADPQGKIPHWISNKTALKGIKQTFENLPKWLLKPRYSKHTKLNLSDCIGFE